MASELLGPTPRRGARLGPALNGLGDRDGGLPPTTAGNDYDIAAPPELNFDHFGPSLHGPGPALAAAPLLPAGTLWYTARPVPR